MFTWDSRWRSSSRIFVKNAKMAKTLEPFPTFSAQKWSQKSKQDWRQQLSRQTKSESSESRRSPVGGRTLPHERGKSSATTRKSGEKFKNKDFNNTSNTEHPNYNEGLCPAHQICTFECAFTKTYGKLNEREMTCWNHARRRGFKIKVSVLVFT